MTSQPIAAPPRSRSHSLSNPNPIPPATSLSPPSLAFSALSLSPGTLPSDSLSRAYHHVRSASFNGATQSRPTSLTDASSTASSELPTPGSSPVPLGMKPGRPSSTKETLFEQDEDLPLSTSPSTLFANGARWGWPQSSAGGGGLPPSPPSSSFGGHTRRSSIGVGQSTSYGMMAPLGRVSSAGATSGTSAPSSKGSEGFGLFRRMSVGFRTKVRSPPPPAQQRADPRLDAAQASLAAFLRTDPRDSSPHSSHQAAFAPRPRPWRPEELLLRSSGR